MNVLFFWRWLNIYDRCIRFFVPLVLPTRIFFFLFLFLTTSMFFLLGFFMFLFSFLFFSFCRGFLFTWRICCFFVWIKNISPVFFLWNFLLFFYCWIGFLFKVLWQVMEICTLVQDNMRIQVINLLVILNVLLI